MDGPGTSARIILMNVYSTSRGSRCRTAGSFGYGGPGSEAGGEVSIDYIMPEGVRGGCTYQACGVDRKQGRPVRNVHCNSRSIQAGFYWNSIGILLGQGDTYRPIPSGYLPPI